LDFSQYIGQIIDPLVILDDYYKTAKKPELQPFFILDEIQDIGNMQELVLYFFTHQYKVFISGSNSKMLSLELNTDFR
jgi:predicted AAA+ superfamily ATPase